MATTPTTNYGWLMPVPGTEVDTWGATLNAFFQQIDTDIFARIGKSATNQILAVVGSSALPSYSFSGDPDTGIYHPAANQIGFTSNGGGGSATFDGTGFNILPTGGVQTISLESTNNTAQINITGAVVSPTQRALLNLRKNRNGAVVATSDVLGAIVYQGYDGAAYQDAIRVLGLVEEAAPGAAAMGGRFRISASPLGTVAPTQLFDGTHNAGLEFEGNIFLDQNRLFQLRNSTFAAVSAGANAKLAHLSDNGGAVARHNGTAWCNINNPTVQTINTDAIFTITPNSSGQCIRHTGTLTANRAVTFGTFQPGDWCEITRTGGGAFTLDVGTGPLKSLATNTWARFRANAVGTIYLAAYGAL